MADEGTVGELKHAVEIRDQVEIVGYHDHVLVEFCDGLHEEVLVAKVEQRRGFVEDDHPRFHDQNARQRDQLTLTTAQLVREAIPQMRDVKPGQDLVEAFADDRGRKLEILEAEFQILFDDRVDDLVFRILEHEADMPPQPAACRIAVPRDRAGRRLSARGRLFSVGGDIKSFARERSAIPGNLKSWAADLHSAIARFMRMRAPVVAVVQGNVAGGSVALVASADIVFAAENTSFSAAFPTIGFSPDSGATVTLAQRMGVSRAKRFLLMSETIAARDALAAGLVDFVVSPDAAFGEAEKQALKFARGPTKAYGGIKELMLRSRTQGLESQMEEEVQMLAAVSRSDDSWEGLNAFLEKRPPRFHGRQ